MARCPIYDSANACDQHRDCLFLRQGGCAIILGMKAALANEEKLDSITQRLAVIDHNLRLIAQALNSRLP